MSHQEYRPAPYSLLPPVVKNLLIINVLFLLAGTVLYDKLGFNINEKLALYFPEAENFAPYQYISYMFLHNGFGHIFMNMFALWMFGSVLENFWGSKRFLLYFLATGIGGAFLQNTAIWYEVSQMSSLVEKFSADPNAMDFSVILNKYGGYITQEGYMELTRFKDEWLMLPGDKEYANASVNFCNMLVKARMSVPTVGASGAVFGLLLAFGMLFPNSLIYVFFAIPIKAKYFVIIYGLFELYAGISNNPGDQVAHFAHLGGMIFGFILIKLWKRKDTGPYY